MLLDGRRGRACRQVRRPAGAARDDNEAVVLERLKVYSARPSRWSSTTSAADVPSIDGAAGAGARGRGSGRGDRGGGQRVDADGSAVVIVCRSAAELERMREAGRLVGEVLTELAAHVAPGVTTADLDALAEKRILAGRGDAGVQGLSRVPGDDLRVDQRRGDPRDSLRPAGAERGRHHLDRRRRLARRLFRRQRDHAAGRARCRRRRRRCCG